MTGNQEAAETTGKKVVMITTERSIQQGDYSPRGEFRNILLYLVATYSPQQILEEWRSNDRLTIGYRVAEEKLAGAWKGISPPCSLNLSWRGYRNLDGLMLREYGPTALQTVREQYMLDQIQGATQESQPTRLIAGLAHQQSLAEKLANLGYGIEAFYWITGRVFAERCSRGSTARKIHMRRIYDRIAYSARMENSATAAYFRSSFR